MKVRRRVGGFEERSAFGQFKSGPLNGPRIAVATADHVRRRVGGFEERSDFCQFKSGPLNGLRIAVATADHVRRRVGGFKNEWEPSQGGSHFPAQGGMIVK